MRSWMVTALVSSALLVACGTNVVNPVTGQTERSAMSEEAEVAEGAKGHQEVLQEYGVVNNPALQSYVNALGQRLAGQSHRSQLQWRFTVLDSPEINAFALPGGYVYVTRGIMAYMDSEADLAGVIGHEIGHVTARHGAQRATSQQNAGLGVLAASVLGAVAEAYGVAGAGQLAGQVSQNVAAGYIASYGREQELQADGLGAEYLFRTRYDPRNMIDVIKVLKNQELFAADQAKAEGRPVPAKGDWLSSHPSNDQRLETISRLAAQYQTRERYDDDGRNRYLQAIQSMNFGDSPDQGLVRGQNFYHEPLGLALTAPAGWYVQNEPEQLAFINTARDAALLVRVVPSAAGKAPADVVRNLLKPTQGRLEPTTINGLQASRFTGARAGANGSSMPVEATVITGPGDRVYLLQSTAKDANALARARAGLREAEGSFRALTAQDRAAARPWVIKTAPYPKGGFAELAKNSPIARPEQQLRLINGYYGGGEPAVGQLVKVVVPK
ncbi:M48 family metalloprotease [Rhodoferax sp. TBRC 17660]|uniref:M48 family metalloprotease n=1 Tax=Rhodoferax potami TaxID=3068338 RepID=A0ABU3KNC7_9BURK|nr:M48 family metalloprotease [Rhodoferax sp. TBRC 17660]MDT7519309.1 M48 family metalloprotease [Rhodoferax sp. TBRC 17660]